MYAEDVHIDRTCTCTCTLASSRDKKLFEDGRQSWVLCSRRGCSVRGRGRRGLAAELLAGGEGQAAAGESGPARRRMAALQRHRALHCGAWCRVQVLGETCHVVPCTPLQEASFLFYSLRGTVVSSEGIMAELCECGGGACRACSRRNCMEGTSVSAATCTALCAACREGVREG